LLVGHSHPAFTDRFGEQEFDLTIQASQFIIGPSLQGGMQPGVDTKQQMFSLGRHDASS
jgi:hypothetical protein